MLPLGEEVGNVVKVSKRAQQAAAQLGEAYKVMDQERLKEFDKLQELTKRLERARSAWEQSLVQCFVLGLSRRDIALVAGVSRQTVQNIAGRHLGDTEPCTLGAALRSAD